MDDDVGNPSRWHARPPLASRAVRAGTGSPAPSAWIENRPSSGRLSFPNLGEVIRFRELAFTLALRDLQVRYKQTFFGVLWAVAQPLAGTAVFAVIFGGFAGVPSEGVPYAVFALSGLVAWTYLSTGLTRASSQLVEDQAFVTKIYFPRLLVPLAAVLPGLVDIVFALVALAVLMAFLGVSPTAAVLLLPVWIVLLVGLTFGVGSLLAAVNVMYRDVGFVLPFFIQLWLFVSPVAYPGSLAEGRLAALYYLNPLAGLLDALRWSAVGTPAPGARALLSVASGLIVVAAGILYFTRIERRFADVI
jgi:lipopolysaccharide transport system permease protein